MEFFSVNSFLILSRSLLVEHPRYYC